MPFYKIFINKYLNPPVKFPILIVLHISPSFPQAKNERWFYIVYISAHCKPLKGMAETTQKVKLNKMSKFYSNLLLHQGSLKRLGSSETVLFISKGLRVVLIPPKKIK